LENNNKAENSKTGDQQQSWGTVVKLENNSKAGEQ
jgi:hypothetical protein